LSYNGAVCNSTLEHLIENNRQWAGKITANDPSFFEKLSHQQKPDYLWIGCSDSRVPANELLGLLPGEVFVHRNVANLVVHTDLNCLSVLQFAIDLLNIKHIIICGHYGCGGVIAALDDKRHGLVDNWLRHIQDVARLHQPELDALSGEARYDRLCELNVLAQRANISETTLVQDAWARGQNLSIHGWIYSIKDGHLRVIDQPITGPVSPSR
jgi:carbonic anhydrase